MSKSSKLTPAKIVKTPYATTKPGVNAATIRPESIAKPQPKQTGGKK